MSQYHCLPLIHSPLVPTLPEPRRHARLDDRALTLFSDLRQGPKIVVDARDGLDLTRHVLMRSSVHMAFVSNAAQEFVGLITMADLEGERPVLSALNDRRAHGDLTVGDLMTPTAQWPTVDLFEIRHASVGDVIATLQECGQRYLLVTETRGDRMELRGLFSARHIEEALQVAIEDDGHSRSFAALGAALTH